MLHCGVTSFLRVSSYVAMLDRYFFKSIIMHAGDSTARFQRLHHLFDTPITELHLLFYQSALQVFIHFNMFLQKEDSLIPVIHDQMTSFLTKLASKFIEVSSIHECQQDYSKLKFSSVDSQLAGLCNILNTLHHFITLLDDKIFIGIMTKMKLQQLIGEGDMTTLQVNVFYHSVRAFYIKAMDYALKNLPLSDKLLRCAAFTNITTRLSSTFSQVEYFVRRYV